VAVVNDATTCKRYKRQGSTVLLLPSSGDYDVIVVTDRDELRICGVVRYTIPRARAVV
jgi:SOS-response transcriptional repressor LexA